jgi:hypothetical protein
MAAGEKDGSNDDKEVLNDKEGNRVWVLLRRQAADYIADYLHRRADDDCGEVPRSILESQEGVAGKCNGEEDGGEDAEGKRGPIAILPSLSVGS